MFASLSRVRTNRPFWTSPMRDHFMGGAALNILRMLAYTELILKAGRCANDSQPTAIVEPSLVQTTVANGSTHEALDLLIVTTWFVGKTDPQKGKSTRHASVEYGKGWIESLQEQRLDGLILHDGLPQNIIDAYPYHKLKFIEVKLGEYSTNDERFLLYHLLLKAKQFWSSDPNSRGFTERVDLGFKSEPIFFFTDLRDVLIRGNPLLLVEVNTSKVFVGGGGSKSLPSWNRRKAQSCGVNITFGSQETFIAGILGGKASVLLRFLDCFVQLFYQLSPPKRHRNCNMPIFNAALRSCFQDQEIVRGAPLHSEFKKWQTSRKDVYFIHKI